MGEPPKRVEAMPTAVKRRILAMGVGRDAPKTPC